MRSILAAILLSTLSIEVAGAQTITPDSESQAAPAPGDQPAVSKTQSVLDMPIETIAAWPGGCATLDRDFPGMRDHPMFGAFKSMSLNQVAAMSGGKITPAMMTQAAADLTALPHTQMAAGNSAAAP